MVNIVDLERQCIICKVSVDDANNTSEIKGLKLCDDEYCVFDMMTRFPEYSLSLSNNDLGYSIYCTYERESYLLKASHLQICSLNVQKLNYILNHIGYSNISIKENIRTDSDIIKNIDDKVADIQNTVDDIQSKLEDVKSLKEKVLNLENEIKSLKEIMTDIMNLFKNCNV